MFKATKNNLGQTSIEGVLVLVLLVVPALTAVGFWINTEWNRNKCAFITYQQARITLLHTQRPVILEHFCGGISEKISLAPLEDLDQDKGGLGFDEAINTVLPLWEQLTL